MAMLKSCLVTYFQSFCFLLKVHKQYISATNLVGAGVAELLLVLPPTPKLKSVCFQIAVARSSVDSILWLCYDWVCYDYKFESTEDRATAI